MYAHLMYQLLYFYIIYYICNISYILISQITVENCSHSRYASRMYCDQNDDECRYCSFASRSGAVPKDRCSSPLLGSAKYAESVPDLPSEFIAILIV